MLGLQNLGDEGPPAAPRRREVSVEILRFVSAVITLVVAIIGVATRFPALSKPWTWDVLIALALLFLLWLSKPRLMAWWGARKEQKREKQFIKTCDAQLRELVARFGQFIADNSNQSFLYLLQSVDQLRQPFPVPRMRTVALANPARIPTGHAYA
jgi:hypothetical protein